MVKEYPAIADSAMHYYSCFKQVLIPKQQNRLFVNSETTRQILELEHMGKVRKISASYLKESDTDMQSHTRLWCQTSCSTNVIVFSFPKANILNSAY